MLKINSFKQELLCIILSVLFLNLYLICEEPKESLCLILSFYFLFKIFNKKKDIYIDTNKNEILIMKFSVVLITYIIIQILLLFNMEKIDLTIEKNYIERQEKAVLLAYQGEASKYNLKTQARNINLNGDIKDRINKTFVLNKYKRIYGEIGKSDYRKKVNLVKEKLSKMINKERYEVYVGFLNDKRHIKEVLVEIANDGYHEVIVVPMFIKNDKYYTNMKKSIEEMQLFNQDISIKYTEGFKNNEGLTESYMTKIDNEIEQVNRSSTGVILIGSGENPLEEELLFRSKIEDYLHKFSKIEKNKIKKAWFSNTKPNYIDEMKDLLELGVSNIIIIYTEPGVTNKENNEIYKNISGKIDFPEGVKVKIIDGFLTEDKLIEEIEKQVEILEIMK